MTIVKGRYIGIKAVIPYGSYRQIIIENSHRYVFMVNWRRAEKELKGIHVGDLVRISYEDDYKFKIKKIKEGKK